jgi:hypothetical protein
MSEQTFRASRWLIVAVILAADLLIGAAAIAYFTRGPTMVTVVLIGLAVIGLAGVVETFVRRIVLEGDVLRIVDLWSRRQFARSDIVRVTYAKGSPVAIQLQDGRWVRLPDLGVSAQRIAAAIRAWTARG